MTEDIPEDSDAFLAWLKVRTEAIWSDLRPPSLEDFRASGVGGRTWRNGTRWQPGLRADEIDRIEQRWHIGFPADYRRFLSLLNAPDRGMFAVDWSEEPPYDLIEVDDEPSFFDWLRDDNALRAAMDRPQQGLLFDIDNNGLWLKGWGPRPATLEGRIRELARAYVAAPPLVPLTGHRYLIGRPAESGNPVLSVWQSDIIVYGACLRDFLLLEFSDLLGLDRDRIADVADAGITADAIAAIPFWGELILNNR